MRDIGEKRVIVRRVVREAQFEILHQLRHHKVATTVQFERGRAVLRGPLEVDDVEGRTLFGRSIHAPQPGVAT